jgi:predicted nuclease of predicted toxin-antitoxin system
VRLFLDAHISGRRIAQALRRRHNDVRAADEERQLDGATDEALLELATDENRIMVTFNVADFPDIARRWAEAKRSHAGLIIIVGIDHREFGTILRAIERCLTIRPDRAAWNDLTLFVSRSGR